MGSYYRIAPAYAIRGRGAADPASARADAVKAVDLARQIPGDLALAYTLTVCGDTLIDAGDDTGLGLLTEARSIIDRCPGSYRISAWPRRPVGVGKPQHRPEHRCHGRTADGTRDRRAPLPADQAVPTRHRLRAVRVAQHRQDPLRGRLSQARRRRPQSCRPGRPRPRNPLTPGPHARSEVGGARRPERLSARRGRDDHDIDVVRARRDVDVSHRRNS